jgi:hypothetical protein
MDIPQLSLLMENVELEQEFLQVDGHLERKKAQFQNTTNE